MERPNPAVPYEEYTNVRTARTERGFFFQAEDGIRDLTVTGVQTCALPISDESSARSALAGIEGRNQSWRPRLGGKLQGRRTGGRKRRQQGKRFSGRREALALRGRRCDARFDVSPRSGRHRRQFVSVARLEEPAFSRSHGKPEGNGKEFESRESG